MACVLRDLVGSKTAEKIFLHLFHYGETYATAVSRDLDVALGPVQRQLDRFEGTGLLQSKLLGRTRVYTFNPKSPITKHFKEIVSILYNSIPLHEKETMFSKRRRTRRKGKPVISNVSR